jgi:hypothetical protein
MEPTGTGPDADLSAAVCIYLARYPGPNQKQFNEVFADRAEPMRRQVRSILTETIKIDLDWDGLSLRDGGYAVKAVMAERHPRSRPTR